MNEKINLNKGKYAIKVGALHKDKDEASVMASYLADTAIVTCEDELIVTLMLKEDSIITGFQIGNPLKASITQQVNPETNSRFELFQLTDLYTFVDAQVQYKVEHEGKTINGDEALRLYFDAESLEAVES